MYTNIEQTAEIFRDYDQITFYHRSYLAFFGMAAPLYCFGIKVPEFPGRVVISTREIVGNVVRDRDLVAKRKIAIYLARRVW